MTQFQISHFNKPSPISPWAKQATRYIIEAHNIRNAMRKLWDDHRVNLVNGDWITWQDENHNFHRLMINQ